MISMSQRPDPGVSSVSAYKSGPRQGMTGAPSMAQLRNPTLVNSKISLDTNVTTSLPLMIRPWLDGHEKEFGQGSILFVCASTNGANRLNTVADLPLMNFILERAHRDIDAPKQRNMLIKDLDSMNSVDGWNCFGILRNDMMADSSLQKLLNVDVFGRAMVANVWGKLVRGDHVGLGIVKMNTAREYKGFIQPSGTFLPSIVINQPVGDNDGILQIVPVLNKKVVTVETLNIKPQPDASKPVPLLQYIPLGVVSHAVAREPAPATRKMALRSQGHYMRLPRVEILMI